MIFNDSKFFRLPYCKMKCNKFGIKVIDLPGEVWIRKKFTKRSSTKEHLVKSMEERPEETNSGQTTGQSAIRTLIERQIRYAITREFVEKKAEYVNKGILECMNPLSY